MIDLIHKFIIPAAYSVLPDEMKSDEATAMLLAIGLQESKFRYRTQVKGPAHGFWQFELGGGCKGIVSHPLSRPHLKNALTALRYDENTLTVDIYNKIVDNDVLATICARLLLWTDPRPLPKFGDDPESAWMIYNSVWRPGKPHRETWDAHYALAWNKVKGN